VRFEFAHCTVKGLVGWVKRRSCHFCALCLWEAIQCKKLKYLGKTAREIPSIFPYHVWHGGKSEASARQTNWWWLSAAHSCQGQTRDWQQGKFAVASKVRACSRWQGIVFGLSTSTSRYRWEVRFQPPGATSGNRTPLQSVLLPRRAPPVLNWFYVEYSSPFCCFGHTFLAHWALCCFSCQTLVLALLSSQEIKHFHGIHPLVSDI
jgi:hypothetical protein